MQNIFLKNMSQKNKYVLVQNQLSIVQACVDKNIPIIELEYDVIGMPKGKTVPQLHSQYRPLRTIIKKDNGGFTNTPLGEILSKMDVKEIILIGINANSCVQDTAIGGLNRGYRIMTAIGTIANVWRSDLELSRSNRLWYQKKRKLVSSPAELIACL